MSRVLFANNSRAVLDANVLPNDTVITVVDSSDILVSNPATDEVAFATIQQFDNPNIVEVVKVLSKTPTTLTVERDIAGINPTPGEGTFFTGPSPIEMRLTQNIMENCVQLDDLFVGDDPPPFARVGMRWISSEKNNEYNYYENGGNPAWVEIGTAKVGGDPIPPPPISPYDLVQDARIDANEDALAQLSNTVDVDASLPELAGRRYQTYADAVAYILGVDTPSASSRWGVMMYGTVTEAPQLLLNPWIYPIGVGVGVSVVTPGNCTNIGAEADPTAYAMYNISCRGVDPKAGTQLNVWNCFITDQQATVGSGTVVFRGSLMNNPTAVSDFSDCFVEARAGSRLNIVRARSIVARDSEISMRGAVLLTLDLGNSTLNNDVGASLPLASLFAANSTIYCSGGNIECLGNSNVFNTVVYSGDVVIDGATLFISGFVAGTTTEDVVPINGGVVIDRGEFFDNTNTGLTADDTINAIKELDIRTYTESAQLLRGYINQTTTYAEFLSLNFTPPVDGDYWIEWSFVWSINGGSPDMLCRVLLDGASLPMDDPAPAPFVPYPEYVSDPTNAGGSPDVDLEDINNPGVYIGTGTTQRYMVTMKYKVIGLTAAPHTAAFQWAGGSANQEAAIYTANLEVRKA